VLGNHLATMVQFHEHELCVMLAEIHSGALKETCDDVCQDEVTALYEMSQCKLTRYESDTCDMLFNARAADYASYAPHYIKEEYSCKKTDVCKSYIDYLLTEHYEECFRTYPPHDLLL